MTTTNTLTNNKDKENKAMTNLKLTIENEIVLLHRNNEFILFAELNKEVKVYYLKEKDCRDISDTELDVIDYQDQGFKLLDEKYYQETINKFNEIINK